VNTKVSIDTRKVCARLFQFAEGNDQITQAQTKTSHSNTPHTGVFTTLVSLRLLFLVVLSAKETAVNTNTSNSYIFIIYLSYCFKYVNHGTNLVKSRIVNRFREGIFVTTQKWYYHRHDIPSEAHVWP